MFVGVTKRLRRKGGLGVAFGVRLTKKNVLWFGLIWLVYIISYYTMWLTVWAIIGIVYALFVWPYFKIRDYMRSRKQAQIDSEQ